MVFSNDLLKRICDRLLEAVPELNEMDSKNGDGETGSNLSRGLLAMGDHIHKNPGPSNLRDIGMLLNSSGCGTLGTLWSFLLLKCDKATALPEALDLLEQTFQKHSGAQVGDKTMGDALLPWIESLRSGESLNDAIAKSRKKVEETANLTGKFGRSKYAGDRSLGTIDPGAHATWIILDEISKGLTLKEKSHEEVP